MHLFLEKKKYYIKRLQNLNVVAADYNDIVQAWDLSKIWKSKTVKKGKFTALNLSDMVRLALLYR